MTTAIASPHVTVADSNNNASNTSISNASVIRQDRRLTIDSSMYASDTSSFRAREKELDGMKTRFPGSLERTGTGTPIQSKFKEDFDATQASSQNIRSTRSSLFSKLQVPGIARLMSKSYDGAGYFELQVPQSRPSFGFSFSNQGQSTGSASMGLSPDALSPGAISPGAITPGGISPGARSPVGISPGALTPVGTSPGARSPLRPRSPGARRAGSRSLGLLAVETPSIDPLQVRDEEAGGVWAKALKKTQNEFELKAHAARRSSKKERKDVPGSFAAFRNSISVKLMKGKQKANMDEGEGQKSEADPLADHDYHFEMQRTLRRQAEQIEASRVKAEQWADELDARERQAKAKSAAIGRGRSLQRSTLPPSSWARFPSHDRSERTTSAGPDDNVDSKDFAIKEIKDGEIEWKMSDRKHHHHHHEKEHHHSLPVRLSRQIRASLYKLRATKSTVMTDAGHGNRSSISLGGKLEFPELEMLPGAVMETRLCEEVERETEAEMRINERIARQMVFSDGSDIDIVVEDMETGDISQVSIADPKFYDDCIRVPSEDGAGDDVMCVRSTISAATVEVHKSPILDKSIFPREKYKTWSGKDRVSRKFMDGMVLRRSTVDFQVELEMMERLERERVIKTAEEAWGTVSP